MESAHQALIVCLPKFLDDAACKQGRSRLKAGMTLTSLLRAHARNGWKAGPSLPAHLR